MMCNGLKCGVHKFHRCMWFKMLLRWWWCVRPVTFMVFSLTCTGFGVWYWDTFSALLYKNILQNKLYQSRRHCLLNTLFINDHTFFVRPMLAHGLRDFGRESVCDKHGTDFESFTYLHSLTHTCIHTLCKHMLCCPGGPLYQHPWEVWAVVLLTAQSGSTLTISSAICWALSSLFRG